MKNNFDQALEWLLNHEGGFVNHPQDPGGMTNLGVTKKVYEQWLGRDVTESEMRDLKPSDVAPLYKKKYWNRIKCDQLPQGVDVFCFDWCVNSGPKRPAQALQRIIGATADGVIGPKSLQAVSDFDEHEVLEKMHESRQKFYESLGHFKTFGRGWTRRNDEMLEQAQSLL